MLISLYIRKIKGNLNIQPPYKRGSECKEILCRYDNLESFQMIRRYFIGFISFMMIALVSIADSQSQYSRINIIFKDQVAVLMYHHISNTAKGYITITPELFQKQLSYLQKKGYNFITAKEFRNYLSGSPVVDNALLVTFDDGYESFYSKAYPILKSLNVPAVNFVVTKNLENPESTYIPSLSRKEILDMTAEDATIKVQCHSDSFHSRTKDGSYFLTSYLQENGSPETANDYNKRVLNDTQACIDKLKQLSSTPIDFYAYPFGAYNKAAENVIRQAGINYAFTVVNEIANRNDDPMQIPRINAGSPNITPENLDRIITRHAVDWHKTFDYIPIREGVEQIGGTILQDTSSSISINYMEKHYLIDLNSLTVTLDNGKIPLEKPLKRSGSKLYISFLDFKTLMGVDIVYNPITKVFFVRTINGSMDKLIGKN
jgi:poly-beta-1,6-N-acetyl-D-glucosamine N-deacetylase